jgi:hypothetical protein
LLDGRDKHVLDQLESSMYRAAGKLDFERAAYHRDTWQQVGLLCGQLEMMRQAQKQYWFVYPLPRSSRRRAWMLVAGGAVVDVVRDPKTPGAARRCLDLVDRHLRDRRTAVAEDYEQTRLLTAWFRQHPEQWEHVLEPREAAGICRARCRSAGGRMVH